jgi:drug/metabolite transporter (DMT)-like permease
MPVLIFFLIIAMLSTTMLAYAPIFLLYHLTLPHWFWLILGVLGITWLMGD